MSRDDARSDVSRLFDDGLADEDADVCDSLFNQGIKGLVGEYYKSLEAARNENNEGGAVVQPVAQLPPSTPSPQGHVVQTTPASDPVPAPRMSVDALTATSSQTLPSAQNLPQPLVAAPGTPGLPPFPPQASTTSPATNNTGVQNSSSQRSSERKKRSELVVMNFFVKCLVPKTGKSSLMVEKRMCLCCKTVVQSKSESMLLHTTNCRFTPLVNKKNARDQSRNRKLPPLHLDSREGPQRQLFDKGKEADRAREAQDAVLSKRPLSQETIERTFKRAKTGDSSSKRTSSSCEQKDCHKLNMAMIRAIVWHNLPLSISERQNSYDTPFLEMLDELRPKYPKLCKPNSDKFRNTYLPLYYEEIRARVLGNINVALSGCYAHGTIMFDGWEDINGSAVVNVMLRVTKTFMTGTTTFFLDSVYTKEKKVGAERYMLIIEEVMKSFQGNRTSPFRGINGTVSDSARACVKAKKMLAEKYPGMVQLQDQAHATDLLLADLGKLPWVKEVLDKVNFIVQATRNNRKLLCRFKDLIATYNSEIKQAKKRVQDLWDVLDSFELEELDNSLSSGSAETRGLDNSASGERAIRTQRTGSVNLAARRTAVTLKKTVKTRFASCETMLEGYVRSRPVLQRLIRDAEFDRLYDASRGGNREKRDSQFVKVIDDDSFYGHVQDMHRVLQIIRRYLRMWDAEKAQVSEVVPATIMLEYALNNLELTHFLTSQRKADIVKALQTRCLGPTTAEGANMQIRILQDVHYATWILDPNMCPVDITRHLPALERHILVYLVGAKTELDDQRRLDLAKAMIKKYKEVHRMWDAHKKGPKNREIIESYAGFAVRYWEDETPAKSVSGNGNDPVSADLECFARSTLALCPSSCATERSFSYQGRIHTKQRNRLAPEVVRNLLFCKWSARVLRNLDRLSFEKSRDTKKLKLGTYVPYEDFFNKQTFSSLFKERESSEVLNKILFKEKRTRQEIVEAREQLYKSPDLYIFASSRGESQIVNFTIGAITLELCAHKCT